MLPLDTTEERGGGGAEFNFGGPLASQSTLLVALYDWNTDFELFTNKYGFKDQIKRYVLTNLLPKSMYDACTFNLTVYNLKQ